MKSRMAPSVLVIIFLSIPLDMAAQEVLGQRAPILGQSVRAWQDSLTLPTFIEGDPQPTPQFAAWPLAVANYPYPLRTNFSKNRQNRAWRSLNLENEYLFCRILPDLGGHLYSCRDKRNGREVFYANPVVRPAWVGLRGAWVAMGIESNFPVGHSRDTVSPVDFALATDSDGSARAVVEDVDRVTGMQWRVEFLLRPGRAVLEQRVLLYNRTAARWPYSWWSNAAITFDDPATRIILPAHAASTHSKAAQIVAWPVTVNGRDGSIVVNHEDPAGWFAYGSREAFAAVYKPGSRSGVVHVADPESVQGKKIWLWGSDGDRRVQTTLTQDFPSYIELQAGVFQNQDTFGFLEPEQFRSFSEYWIPVNDLGGVTRATQDAVLNLDRDAKKLTVELGTMHEIPGATVRIAAAGKVVYEARADLSPRAAYRYRLENAPPNCSVELIDAHGAILLTHTEGVIDAATTAQAPLGKVPDPAWKALSESEALYLDRGEFNERHQLWKFAHFDYTHGLELFPQSVRLKKALGRVDLNLNHSSEAFTMLNVARNANPEDEEAAYGAAVAATLTGQDSLAAGIFSKLPPDSTFGQAAALQLARIAARTGDDSAALAHLKPLLANRSGPVRAGAIEVALLRRSGKTQQAKDALTVWHAADPADSMLRFEATRLGMEDPDLWPHLSVDAERVLNLVDEYLALGMNSEAFALLDHKYPPVSQSEIEPGAVPVELNPLIAYYRAYCRSRLGQDPSADLREAASGYTRYLYPYRASSFAVLDHAMKANPPDALVHLLMARLSMHSLLTDQAIAEWQKARQLDPRLPEVNTELARTLLEVKKDGIAPLPAIREAKQLDPGSTELHGLSNRTAAAILPAKTATPTSETIEAAHNALRVAGAGKAADAARMFNAREFPAEKQPEEVRRVYIDVQLQKLLALARSGQCRSALDHLFWLGNEDRSLPFTHYGFEPFMRADHFQYYAGVLEWTCHDEKDARKRWARIGKHTEPLSSLDYIFPILAAARAHPDEASSRINAALEGVRAEMKRADDGSLARLEYFEAMLLDASGDEESAIRQLQAGLGAEDVWLKFLAGVELQNLFK